MPIRSPDGRKHADQLHAIPYTTVYYSPKRISGDGLPKNWATWDAISDKL